MAPPTDALHMRAQSAQIVESRHSLDEKWATLHLGEVKVEVRDRLAFELDVWLGDLDPIRVHRAVCRRR